MKEHQAFCYQLQGFILKLTVMSNSSSLSPIKKVLCNVLFPLNTTHYSTFCPLQSIVLQLNILSITS